MQGGASAFVEWTGLMEAGDDGQESDPRSVESPGGGLPAATIPAAYPAATPPATAPLASHPAASPAAPLTTLASAPHFAATASPAQAQATPPSALKTWANPAESNPRVTTSNLVAHQLANRPGKSGLIKGPQNADLRGEFEAMQKTMEDQVLVLSEERDTAHEEMRQQSAVLAAVQLERDELKLWIKQLNQQMNDELNQRKTLKGQLDRREKDMQLFSTEFAQIKTQHTETVRLLDARTTELKGAQAFLAKADTTLGSDVVRMIEGLDAEIMQMSAFVADHFEFEHPKPYHTNEDVQAASTRLAELIGPKMVDLLATTEHAQDPLVIQLACQAATAAYCRYIVTSWDVDDDNFNHLLQEAYLTVHAAGMFSSAFKTGNH